MTLITIAFYFFVLVAALSAIGILFSKNVFKAALMLLLCLLSIAALYIFTMAEFIAVTQILIYAGGILVVIIFGIMITSKLSGKPLQVGHTHIFGGLLAGLTVFGFLIYFFFKYLTLPKFTAVPESNSIETLGINFMTGYALPFQMAGILLLVALTGAAVMTSFMKSKKM